MVTSLDAKEIELLVGETPGGSLLRSWCWLISEGRGLRLDWGIGIKVSGIMLRDPWSPGREPGES